MAAQVAPGERGATRIADRVVAKIAARAAREAVESVPADGAPPHATVSVLAPPHDSARAGRTPFGTARVRVSLELDYPCDIGRQCGAVRQQVAERVEALAGMDVPEVVVQVERLHSARVRVAAQGRTR
ncbi:Asp23/Gls24 family envelope stress response protein [Streptomyces alboniger]|uniref:Asp23/Gls24 family envelope stress response protein n=1 Tax=Streptomyces alboniger TaxID=132473 RepID=A0A5J6HK49_STRAD|nr:Asp23/Gls24 family envelope stress response protein [Streptomyces alboniger]QEV17405.1 Asp23/Gls24 family envelope stress response protein [Streptomyces alboniger]